MTSEIVTIKETCMKCDGTGIAHNSWDYKGRIGFTCPSCNGNGFIEHSYEPFIERKLDTVVEHVFSWPVDPFHTMDISFNPTPHLEYSISYEEWLSGKRPAAWIESFYCPFDIFTFGNVCENPCSRCERCLKKIPRHYFDDKIGCWEEVHTGIKNGEIFPKRKKS